MSNPPISVVLLTHNEELHVARALESVRWSDNVVIVDSGSADRTVEICESFPNVDVLQRRFTSFADQRRHALDSGRVRHPWVLGLDADEYVPEALRRELARIAGSWAEGMPVAYDVPMRFVMWGRWLRFSTAYPQYWRRFFRPDRCRHVQRGHADKLEAGGPVGRTRAALVHEDLRDLEHWIGKHNRYSTQEAEFTLRVLPRVPLRLLFSRDRERRKLALKRVVRALPANGFLRFVHLYVLRLGFLDGLPGYHYCRLKAQQNYLIQLKSWEMRRAARRPDTQTS